MEKISVTYKGKKVSVPAHRCSFFGKFSGLMFSQKEKANILLFDFHRNVTYSIHSFFVFYDFLAIWLDNKNNVIQIDKVKPWTVSIKPKKKYTRLIEIPINKKHEKLVKKFTRS